VPLIDNIDAPVLSFFPTTLIYATADKEHINLQDLLTMRAAYAGRIRPYLSMALRWRCTRPRAPCLEQPVVPAGTNWRLQYEA